MNWTPPIAMAQQTNKKRCIIFKNFQVFFSLNLALIFFSIWFWNFMPIELPWNHSSFSTWIPLLPSSWNYLKLYIWNNFRLFPFEFQFIPRLSERNGTWKNFPSSLFPLQPPHNPSRPSAPPTTPPTCPPPPCQPSPSPCPPPGPPPSCSTWSSSSPACLSARHLPPHPSTVTPPSRGGLAHIRHIILNFGIFQRKWANTIKTIAKNTQITACKHIIKYKHQAQPRWTSTYKRFTF